jgi:predicted dehydrogenase
MDQKPPVGSSTGDRPAHEWREMARYRTAVIACGTIGRVHARGWQDVPDHPVALGACADTHPDARREFGEFFGIGAEHRYADYREMLDAERPDIVDVCSWHRQHAEMTIAAAARKPRAIICQKPMALSLGEADAMLTACERNGVSLFIAFQRPHHATWLKARELIRSGVIGRIQQIAIDDGGNILNTNSHNIRLAGYLLEEARPQWVMGAVERLTDVMERGIPCEDRCLGVIGYESGATLLIQGELAGSRGAVGEPGRRLGQGARVIGTDGMMEFWTGRPADKDLRSDGDMAQPEGSSAKYNDEFGVVRYMNATTGGWVNVEATWHDCWAHQCQQVVDVLDGKLDYDHAISNATHGRVVTEIMMGLFESARKRRRIELPLLTKLNPLSLMVSNGDLPVEWPGAYERRSRLVRGEGMTWHEN